MAKQEGVEHVIFKGDKGKIRVKADRFFYGEDKLDHLEGNVEVVDYGRKGGRELVVTADKIDYNSGPDLIPDLGAGEGPGWGYRRRIPLLRL